MNKTAVIHINVTPKFKRLLFEAAKALSEDTGRKVVMTEYIELAVIEKAQKDKRRRK